MNLKQIWIWSERVELEASKDPISSASLSCEGQHKHGKVCLCFYITSAWLQKKEKDKTQDWSVEYDRWKLQLCIVFC